MQAKEDLAFVAHDRSKDPISCIRMDDFEVYLRIQTYKNKIMRPILKMITTGKWIPI